MVRDIRNAPVKSGGTRSRRQRKPGRGMCMSIYQEVARRMGDVAGLAISLKSREVYIRKSRDIASDLSLEFNMPHEGMYSREKCDSLERQVNL